MVVLATPHEQEGKAVEPLLLKVEEAATLLGIRRSKFYELLQAGELPTVRIGRAVRIPNAAVRDYVQRLEAEQNGGDGRDGP